MVCTNGTSICHEFKMVLELAFFHMNILNCVFSNVSYLIYDNFLCQMLQHLTDFTPVMKCKQHYM